MLPKLTFSGSRAGAPGGSGAAPAAQHRVDARDQLARVEGLGQVVVRAHLQADDAVDVLALGGEHDDGHGVLRAAQAPADRQAVFAGEHQVEHQQIDALARKLLVHARRVRDGVHREPLLGEIALQQVAQPQIVVDDQDSCLGIGHRPVS